LLCVDDECRRHSFLCVDDDCRGECWPEPVIDTDGLEPVEPPEHWSGADTRAEFEGAR
jgi:hypothetical protein